MYVHLSSGGKFLPVRTGRSVYADFRYCFLMDRFFWNLAPPPLPSSDMLHWSTWNWTILSEPSVRSALIASCSIVFSFRLVVDERWCFHVKTFTFYYTTPPKTLSFRGWLKKWTTMVHLCEPNRMYVYLCTDRKLSLVDDRQQWAWEGDGML